MPPFQKLWEWVEAYPAFGDQYARARAMQAHSWCDEIVEAGREATEDSAAATRVKVDALKWAASKVLPKVYGDKIQQEHSGGIAIEKLLGDLPP